MRKFAEERFGIDTLMKNPLAQKYLILSDDEAEPIKTKVNTIIDARLKYYESNGK